MYMYAPVYMYILYLNVIIIGDIVYIYIYKYIDITEATPKFTKHA